MKQPLGDRNSIISSLSFMISAFFLLTANMIKLLFEVKRKKKLIKRFKISQSAVKKNHVDFKLSLKPWVMLTSVSK